MSGGTQWPFQSTGANQCQLLKYDRWKYSVVAFDRNRSESIVIQRIDHERCGERSPYAS